MRVDRGRVATTLAFERGGAGDATDGAGDVPVDLAYETYGDPANPTVLVAHALTGSAHVATTPDPADLPWDPPCSPAAGQGAGVYSELVGPGRPVDTDRYHVVAVTVPGSPYGSTSPATVVDGEPLGPAFPPVTVGDWVEAQAAVLDHLGVDRLHAAVGGSVGGMNVLEWARRYPGRVDRVAPIATAPRLGAQVLAIDAVRRRAITTDPGWDGGDYHPDHPDRGLALARQLGHLLYRSRASLDRQFGREASDRDPPELFDADAAGEGAAAGPYRAVASYLDHNAARFVERFDANCYLRLLGAMDRYDLAAGHADAAAALSGFDGAALLVSFSGDWHFPPAASRDLTDAFRAAGADAVHHAVADDYGHDAFIVHPGSYGAELAAFLAGGADAVEEADAAAVGG
jgi:homoserine O-acetyltransferase